MTRSIYCMSKHIQYLSKPLKIFTQNIIQTGKNPKTENQYLDENICCTKLYFITWPLLWKHTKVMLVQNTHRTLNTRLYFRKKAFSRPLSHFLKWYKKFEIVTYRHFCQDILALNSSKKIKKNKKNNKRVVLTDSQLLMLLMTPNLVTR